MKKHLFILPALLLTVTLFTGALAQDDYNPAEYFSNSLHATSRGMGYWYSAEVGGIETLTGIPYDSLSCKHCHAENCTTCHEGETGFTGEEARKMETCLTCHSREKNIMAVDESLGNGGDVHLASGMICMDCHSSRDIHGDSVTYNSMKQEGAIQTACEDCHETVTPSRSHSVHGDKLECKACHERHVLSCTNCHFDHFTETDEKKAMPRPGWMFLMNYEGKVTSANMQNYVVNGDETFLMFAPAHTHSVTRDGRQCEECHASQNTMQVAEGAISLSWLSGDTLKYASGVIPVVDDAQYDFVYHDYNDGAWTPLDSAAAPVRHYAGYGSPLTAEQLEALSTAAESYDESYDIDGNWTVDFNDVIALALLVINDPSNELSDFNGDGTANIADVVSLLIKVREGSSGALLASAVAPGSAVKLKLSAEQISYLESIVDQLGLTDQERAAWDAALYGQAGRVELPRAFSLSQNSPNPFNPSTTISYAVPEGQSAHVSLRVYDLKGALIRTLVEQDHESGAYTAFWDGTNNRGQRVASGVYFYRMVAGDFVQTRKMVLVK